MYSYKIRANIVDLTTHVHNENNRYFVDTNVWYWMIYMAGRSLPSDVRKPQKYQLEHYPKFIEDLMNNQSSLYHCGLNISELGSIIEKTEYEIFINTKTKDSFKNYRRKRPEERKKVVKEIQSAWEQMNSLAKFLPFDIQLELSKKVINEIGNHSADCYDIYYKELMIKNGIDSVISDDADFASIAGITLFTANENLISEAKKQKKLTNSS